MHLDTTTELSAPDLTAQIQGTPSPASTFEIVKHLEECVNRLAPVIDLAEVRLASVLVDESPHAVPDDGIESARYPGSDLDRALLEIIGKLEARITRLSRISDRLNLSS